MWGMAFNTAKCKVLHVGRRNHEHGLQYKRNRSLGGRTGNGPRNHHLKKTLDLDFNVEK